MYQTPGFQRGEIEPDIMDGVRVDVLYKRLRKTWVAVHHAIGATDVWYSWEAYCCRISDSATGGLPLKTSTYRRMFFQRVTLTYLLERWDASRQGQRVATT